jgi:hypothetical protein
MMNDEFEVQKYSLRHNKMEYFLPVFTLFEYPETHALAGFI